LVKFNFGSVVQINGVCYFKIIEFFYSLYDLLIREVGADIIGAGCRQVIGRYYFFFGAGTE
jgi:hypothetical protein